MVAVATPTKAEQTASLVRIIAAAGRRRRRPVPRTLWPTATEREFAKAASALIANASGPAFVSVLDALPRFVAMAKAAQPFGADVRATIAQAYEAMMKSLSVDAIGALARRYGLQVSQHTRAMFQRQAVAALGVDLTVPDDRNAQAAVNRFIDNSISHLLAVPEMLTVDVEKRIIRALSVTNLDAAPRKGKGGERPVLVFNRPTTGTRTTALGFGDVPPTPRGQRSGTPTPPSRSRGSSPSRSSPAPQTVRNVRLIVNRPQPFDPRGIAAAVERNVKLGGSTAELADELSDRFGFFEDHAAFIARDQVGKLQGQSSAARQQALGLTRFEWQTAGDERVRDDHAERDGEIYEYDNPPDGELPGEPINCRCTAMPVFEDVIDALDE